jgi:hypothetical protein
LEEPCTLRPNIIKVTKLHKLRWDEKGERIREIRKEYNILIGASLGKRPLNRPYSKYYWDDQIKEDEMGRACSTLGQITKCAQNFRVKA